MFIVFNFDTGSCYFVFLCTFQLFSSGVTSIIIVDSVAFIGLLQHFDMIFYTIKF